MSLKKKVHQTPRDCSPGKPHKCQQEHFFNYGNGTCPNPQHCFWSITEMPHTVRLAAQIIALANYCLVAQQEVNCTNGIFSQLNTNARETSLSAGELREWEMALLFVCLLCLPNLHQVELQMMPACRCRSYNRYWNVLFFRCINTYSVWLGSLVVSHQRPMNMCSCLGQNLMPLIIRFTVPPSGRLMTFSVPPMEEGNPTFLRYIEPFLLRCNGKKNVKYKDMIKCLDCNLECCGKILQCRRGSKENQINHNE